MTPLNYVVAAAIVAAPMLLAVVPAEAITARQTALQGQGLYTTSKGVPEGYGTYGRPRGWHRHWRQRRMHY